MHYLDMNTCSCNNTYNVHVYIYVYMYTYSMNGLDSEGFSLSYSDIFISISLL